MSGSSPAAGSAQGGVQQWLRRASLTIGGDSGNALDLSGLRFAFKVRQSELQTPNICDIRIYNLAPDTANRIQREFTRILLSAGYQDNASTIFSGEIKQLRRGKESPVDSHIDILAADGDKAYNFATVRGSLAAGYTTRDLLAAIEAATAPYGVTLGYLPPLPATQAPRGRVLYGMARDLLREVAEAHDLRWSVQNGRIIFVPRAGYIPGQAVVLTSASGLIGRPEQTIDGLVARCLLNPEIHYGRAVQINNSSIQQARANPSISREAVTQNYILSEGPARLAEDGFYRVLAADHLGDTHGKAWYTEIVCVSLGQSGATAGQLSRGRA